MSVFQNLLQLHSFKETVTLLTWICVLIRIAWIDIKTMTIPDGWNLLLGLIGIVSIWTMSGVNLTERLIGMGIISIPMIMVDLALPGGFGGGDIKLMAAAGLLLGWKRNLYAAVIGVMTAGVYAIFLLITGRAGRKDAFAFGPFLSAGLAAALFIPAS
ncbi:MAG: prepilin peptidase [Eubacterium sp.]|nr:prepilin peptidase [Eubacterium sp.]